MGRKRETRRRRRGLGIGKKDITNQEQKPLVVYSAQYEGGHPLYPERKWVHVSLFEDYLMIKQPKFKGEGIKHCKIEA